MKKRYSITLFSIIMMLAYSALTYAATGPAYPEVPVSERTSNLAENQNFVNPYEMRANNTRNGIWKFYDMYGQEIKSARLAGGNANTNNEGIAILVNEANTSTAYGWRQDVEKQVNENGISNWYYGDDSIPFCTSEWQWLPDQDNIFSTKKAYCFNEYGYLYVNTITPDGFIVNERGQMITEDGILVEHEHDALTHDAMRGAYIGRPIGFMRERYFTTCMYPECGGRCFTGANEKDFPDRDSQYTYEEVINKRREANAHREKNLRERENRNKIIVDLK